MFSGTALTRVMPARRSLLRTSLRLSVAVASTLSACQCDTKLRGAAPKLVADPDPIVVNGVVGRATEQVVKITNKGFSTLVIPAAPEVVTDVATPQPVFAVTELFTKDCTGAARTGSTTSLTVGECAELKVRYLPIAVGNNDGNLVFKCNDPRGTVKIPIKATAVTNTINVCLEDGGTETCNTAGQPLVVTWADLVAVGATSSKSFKLKSQGTQSVEIDSMVLSGDIDFSTTPAASGFTQTNLAPASDWPFSINVMPIAGGLRSAKVIFTTSDPQNPNLEVDVSLTGDGPGLCWCIGSDTQRCTPSTTANFGDVVAGATGNMFLEMSSCGTQPLVFVKQSAPTDAPVSITAGGDVFAATGLPTASQSLAPGAAAIHVPLTFKPPMTQTYTGRLEINTNIQTGTIALTGNGTMGGCALSAPALLDMGSVQRGGAGTKQFAVSNRGTEACTFPSAPVVTMGADVKFAITAFPLNPIAAGGTAQFTVSYQPQDLVGPDTGELTISYLGQSEPTTAVAHTLPVQLKGTPVAQCKLKATPAIGTGLFGGRLNFGQVQVNTEAILPVTLTNTGASNCTVSNARIIAGLMSSGGAFKIAHPIPATTVNPGQSLVIDVSFKPTSDVDYGAPIGNFGDIVAVNTSDAVTFDGTACGTFPPGPAGCAGWGLAGTGVRSPLQVLPPNLDFGEVTLGCNSNDRTVTLYNIGSSTIHITELKVDPAPPPTIFTVSAPGLPFAINAGAHVDISVRYTPPDAMSHSASLFIKSDATASSSNPYVTVSLRGSGTTNAHQTDTFQQAAQPKTDVLFIVDDSGSMSEEQGHLADNASRFAGIADQLHSDYHIAVVTTDVENASESGKFQGSPKIITPSTQAASQFASRVRALGTNGSGTERGLEGMYLALSDPLINDPMNNAGFLRDDAKLAIVAVGDEDDQSTESVDFFYNFLLNIKGPYNSSLVTFNAIVGDTMNNHNSMGDVGCTSSDGDAVAGYRFVDLQQRTGGKFRSICTGDWGSIASDLGLDIFAARAGFTLTRVPDVSTIVVHVNGNLIPGTNWTFNARANAVVFNPNALPAAGSTIVIDYDAHCF
jgi:hypothetical protein